MPAASAIPIQPLAPIPTWFRIGGRAERFALLDAADLLSACIELDPDLRVLGDGANLLVDDDGVPELVVQFVKPSAAALGEAFADALGSAPKAGRPVVRLPAGCELPEVILHAVRAGLGGIEGLGGIPATLGGAVIMNAGGAFGQIADAVYRVHACDRTGARLTLDRSAIDFGYRQSGLNHLIITDVELSLHHSDPAALRARLKEVMAYKKGTQPLAADSAGCVFKNPTLVADAPALASLGWSGPTTAGSRVSAGFLIDKAGCKGLVVGGAGVSERHGNFILTTPQALARDVISLMSQVRRRVFDRFGITLHPEVVIWSRREVFPDSSH
ncbi:MAG: UDP-N-acetylmuramate dehydrogenase [Phycisphaerales bacterium]